ncbi:MAG TPA: energy transducer TonB [Ignavibacteriaceae bacterium]|nr:energy transducer TonB [Ignavibacteriaceae bacterium]
MKFYGCKLLLILCIFFAGCYGLKLPENTEDVNNPNRGPILITPGEIDYPKLAKSVNIEGIVEVDILVDTTGIVTEVEIVTRKFNSDGVYTEGKTIYLKDIVDEPTINYFKNCKYLPALQNGRPIKSIVRTGMHFQLK